LIADILGDKHDLVHAQTGPAGLQQVGVIKPELILRDIGLPDMDGLEVVQHLKADGSLAHIPVVALTAHAMSADREKCMEAGCDDYMSKPVNVRELIGLAKTYLSVRNVRGGLYERTC
jgi:CheY-like chemotaxis protein